MPSGDLGMGGTTQQNHNRNRLGTSWTPSGLGVELPECSGSEAEPLWEAMGRNTNHKKYAKGTGSGAESRLGMVEEPQK